MKYKIILLGHKGSGKTCLINRKKLKISAGITDEKLETTRPTVGCEFHPLEMDLEDDDAKIIIWDHQGTTLPPGEGESKETFFQGATACALVFDLTNQKSFHELDEWKKYCFNNLDEGTKINILLIGCKADDVNNIKVQEAEITKWCNENALNGNPITYIKTSAKKYTNVDEAFDLLIKYSRDKIEADEDATAAVIEGQNNEKLPKASQDQAQGDGNQETDLKDSRCCCTIF